jgi:serine/threonine-protein kinase RIO1
LSPRAFETKRSAVESWCKKELEELQRLRESLERGQVEVAKALRRAKRDISFASRLARSEVNL